MPDSQFCFVVCQDYFVYKKLYDFGLLCFNLFREFVSVDRGLFCYCNLVYNFICMTIKNHGKSAIVSSSSNNINGSEMSHVPVLLEEILQSFDLPDKSLILDCTFGSGGHSRAILGRTNFNVVAIDRDSSVNVFANALFNDFGNRFKFMHGNFSQLVGILRSLNINNVNGILLDLGISSMQLDSSNRGFSFLSDAPLDMRMNVDDTITAYDIVNATSETDLANLLYSYSDEYRSKAIAKRIVEERNVSPIKTTGHLARIVRKIYPSGKHSIDPATKTFMAIRMAVNRELDELYSALDSCLDILCVGGVLSIISFHSTEDRIVKRFMREHSGYNNRVKKNKYDNGDKNQITYDLSIAINKPLVPSSAEIARNPRARSAKLRIATRN